MPETPADKLHPHPRRRPETRRREPSGDGPGWAELHCLSNFSFLRGASHPEELVERAAALGYRALALTDENTLAGSVRGHLAAREAGLPYVVGAELRFEDGLAFVALARDRGGYGRLCRLLSRGRRRAEKGSCRLLREDLIDVEGLLALALPDEAALRPRAGEVELERAAEPLAFLRERFGDRVRLAAALPEGPDDRGRMDRLELLESRLDLPLVAARGVEAHRPARRPLRDVLAAIRTGVPVARLGALLPPRGPETLEAPERLLRRHARRPELVERALELAESCRFSLDEIRYEYPDETAGRDLRTLTRDGARQRWPEGVPERIDATIERELALIEEMRYESYFLTVHDIVRFARSRGILCQGRGSAANSAVCYCLGITSVDPEHFDLLFERFVSRDRDEPPDIDVDFEHERREEVLQYVYERYGRSRAALAATVITYRGRSAVRDVGKALDLSLDQVERLARTLTDRYDRGRIDAERVREAGLDPEDATLKRVIALSGELLGFPRHLSQHVGGMVITRGRLDEIVPIENAAMDGRTVIQWDKDDIDAMGLLKVDCLGLGMLTAIRRAFDLIDSYRGARLDLASLPREVTAVYAMAERADTVGVFQIESRAQMAMLPRFRPRRFYDLVIEIAIVRPGPIQGGMVHPYLRRRAGLEPVSYPSEEVRGVLERTLGVPIFQEQVMKLAVVAAGFTPGEADRLRRAMSSWRRHGELDAFRERLMAGMRERGYPESFAEALYRQIRGFGEYGFPESHAASFAHLTYVSLWLKRFEPAAFCCALLNSLPMGFYGPAQLVADARTHGVEVRPVDVLRSAADSGLETDGRERFPPVSEAPEMPPHEYGRTGPALRLGLRLVKGLEAAAIERLLEARAERPFASVEDCVERARLDRRAAARLAEAGAFDALTGHRREAWWRAAPGRESTPLYREEALREPAPELSEPERRDLVFADYRLTGLSLEAHPMALVRPELRRLGALSSGEIRRAEDGWPVTTVGLCICRQKPATASGILFATLEDEEGFVNVVVRRREQERFRKALLGGSVLLVKGRIERVGDVVHLLAAHVEDRDVLLDRLRPPSRDFH